MNENLILSLQITALGMGIVFAAIILLSLMMSLLTRLTAEKVAPPPDEIGSDSPETGSLTRPFGSPSTLSGTRPAGRGGQKAQAAAVAVAIALAEQRQVPPTMEPETTLVSAWQLGMRTRQMYQKGGRKSS